MLLGGNCFCDFFLQTIYPCHLPQVFWKAYCAPKTSSLSSTRLKHARPKYICLKDKYFMPSDNLMSGSLAMSTGLKSLPLQQWWIYWLSTDKLQDSYKLFQLFPEKTVVEEVEDISFECALGPSTYYVIIERGVVRDRDDGQLTWWRGVER